MTRPRKDLTDARLRALFERPAPPTWLEERLHCNHARQANAESRRSARWRWALGLSVAANILLVTGLVAFIQRPADPGFIEQAVAHLHEEAGLHGAMDGGYTPWLQRHAINTPPGTFRVTLSKNCHIGTVTAKHLRLAMPDNAPVNLLIYSRQLPAGSPDESRGELDGIRWIAFRVRGDLYAMAMFDRHTPEREVRQLLRDMFPRDWKRNVYTG